MTIRTLQIFVAAAEMGKMSEAARRMYITQSSVSQAITSIEEEYHVQLFERLPNGLVLTDSGKELLAYARSLLSVKADMEEYLNSSGEVQKVHIGATVTVGSCILSPLLKQMNAEFENLRTEIIVDNTRVIESNLLKRKLDVALVEGRIVHPELVTEPVIQDRLVLICSPNHRFYGRESIKAAELAGEDFVLREIGSGTRAQFETQMAKLHIPINVRWSCSVAESIRTAVGDGHGLSVLSERLVQEDAANGRLWACSVSDLELERNFDIVYRKDKYVTRAMQAFMDSCRQFELEEKLKKENKKPTAY